jgi:hypothetical protein
VRLLEAILADLPKLDGANCRGRHELYYELPRALSCRQYSIGFSTSAASCVETSHRLIH